MSGHDSKANIALLRTKCSLKAKIQTIWCKLSEVEGPWFCQLYRKKTVSMKLYRYVLAYFGHELKQTWKNKSVPVDDVIVSIGEPKAGNNGRKYWLVNASMDLATLPKFDDKNRILVPNEEREKCEVSAWHVINIISVFETCPKEIYSPASSCVAFGFENPPEREFLEKSKGIFAPERQSESSVHWTIETTPEVLAAIGDRFDGVALLSESCGGSEGHQYRELVRFIELAFGLSFYDQRLAKKLTQFLRSEIGGYERGEVNGWVNLRHPTMHGDYSKTNWIAISSDVRSVVLRMRQACLDVLFNKERWRDPSSSRRKVWIPNAIPTSITGPTIVKQGTAFTALFRIFDEFGLHPVLREVTLDHSQDHLYGTYWQPDQSNA